MHAMTIIPINSDITKIIINFSSSSPLCESPENLGQAPNPDTNGICK